MKLSLVQRLNLGLGAAMLVVAGAGALMLKLSFGAEETIRQSTGNATGAAALSDAQSALWELRYGFPQFMLVDEAGRKKITEAEPKLRARIEENFKRYEAHGLNADETKALAELRAVFAKYMDARPKWFELMAAGKADEAKEWRAATTTPFGAATVKGFGDVLGLQLKSIQEDDAAALRSVKTERAVIAALLLLVVAGSLVGGLLFTRSLRRSLAEANAVTIRLAQGDLSVQPRRRSDDEIGELMTHLAQMSSSLRQLIGNVRASSDSIGTASTQIASGNHDLSARTEQTASSLQQTASSMEELTGTVKQTADSARTANQLASSAREVAARGGSVVAQVVSTMDEINTSSKKIADIIGTIDGIAFQTNILALNAAVEAARAGEQGRGFAVVASEVRSLAQRSAEAAREIKALIGASVDRVESGSRLVQDAGSTMTEIVASVQRVTDIIGEISAAAGEQSSGIGQVNNAVAQLDQMTQQNAALVEQSAAAAESLKDQSRQLIEAVSAFNIGADVRGANRASPERMAKAVIAQSRSAASHCRAHQTSAPAPVVSATTPARASGSAAAAAASGDGWETI